MRVGLIIPTGYWGEFAGWHPPDVWKRVLDIARLAERLGFDSLWVGEHLAPKWDREAPLYDGVPLMTAIASHVPRVDIGFVVLNTTFRNPAATAKMATAIDAISGGRLVVGLGAGFREEEARPYGFDFPGTGERLSILAEHLEVISRMTRVGEPPVSFSGRHITTTAAVNSPRTGGRDHIPLLIGGHGPNVTFRLAARYCDEINIDVLPDRMAESMAVLADRCQEIGRDPATLKVAAAVRGSWPYRDVTVTGGQRMITQADMPAIMGLDVAASDSRVAEIARWKELGVDRLVCGVPGSATTDESIHELVEHLALAGVPLEPQRA